MNLLIPVSEAFCLVYRNAGGKQQVAKCCPGEMYIDSEMHQVKACACECPLCFSGGFNTNNDRHVALKKSAYLSRKTKPTGFYLFIIN